MTNIGKYYNYLSLSEATTTTSFSSGDKDEDKYNQYSPSGMFTTSATQTAQSADGGDWDGGRHHDDDEDDLEPDPSIGDIPERVEQLWDYVDWWVDLLPQFEGAANTISRLMVQPSMSPQDWYDFFYEMFGFGHNGADLPTWK